MTYSESAVNFLELLDVDIVAAGIDDNFLGTPDNVQTPVVIEAPEVSGVKPSVAQNFGGRGLVAIVTGHHVRPVRDYLANRSRRRHQLDLDAVQWASHRADLQRFVGPRDSQNRCAFSQTVAFEQRNADVVEKLRDAMGQGGTAADREPQPSAQRGMNLSENNRAEVEARVRVEAAIEIAQVVEGGMKKRTARFDFIDDAPMDRLPHRGHSYQRSRTDVGERARQRLRIDLERIDDRRAAG